MSVYVDDMEAQFGRMVMCHMWADTYPELIDMAKAIGVDLRWLQYPPKARWVHFDIALSKRALAVANGATEKRWRDIGDAWLPQRFEPSYRQFYKAWIEGYEAASEIAMYVPPEYVVDGQWVAGYFYAWSELGLKVPDDMYTDDIPF